METNDKSVEQVGTSVSMPRRVAAIVALAFVAWGIWEVADLFIGHRKSVTTDDAQVEQYISPVNIRVPGYIKKVSFTEHEYVHKGDTILMIEDYEYRIRLKQAEAQLQVAQLEKDCRRYGKLLEKKAATQIAVEQYQTQLEMARARVVALMQQRDAALSSVSEVGQRQVKRRRGDNACRGRRRAGAAQPVVHRGDCTVRRLPGEAVD